MTQTIHPLFGEYINDQSIARASAQRPGWTCRGEVALSANATVPANWDITINPDSAMGFCAWRTAWDRSQGAFHVVEDAPVVVARGITPPATGQSLHVLILGRWKWVAGPISGTGEPTGVMTDSMRAIYAAIPGTSSATPSDPSITPDASGRADVVLARVVLTAGASPRVEWLPATNLDLAQMSLSIEGKHNIEGDERHVGKFKVSAEPADDEDVVRKVDVHMGAVRPYVAAGISSQRLGTVYPRLSGASSPVPMPLGTTSGIHVEALAGGGWRARRSGIFKVDFSAHQYGSGVAAGYFSASWFTKLASNTSAGFAVQQFDGSDFFASAKSEAVVEGSLLVEMSENDVLGAFLNSSGGYTAINLQAVVQWLGERAPTDVLEISTGAISWNAAAGQTYPATFTTPLAFTNAFGDVTWSIDPAGEGQIDGTTTPAATITNGSTLSIVWATEPTLPMVKGVKLRGTDAEGNVATKTIQVTLGPAVTLTITTALAQQASAYPWDMPISVYIPLTSTGGLAPVTWEVIADADTTLPGAAIVGTNLQGSSVGIGTFTAKIKATDSTPTTHQTDTKVVTITTTLLQGGTPPPS